MISFDYSWFLAKNLLYPSLENSKTGIAITIDSSIKKATTFRVGHFTTISGHFFTNCINIFHKTEVQMVILRRLTCINLNCIKSYDIQDKFFCQLCFSISKKKQWKFKFQKWQFFDHFFLELFIIKNLEYTFVFLLMEESMSERYLAELRKSDQKNCYSVSGVSLSGQLIFMSINPKCDEQNFL